MKKSDFIVRIIAAVILLFFVVAATSYFVKDARCKKALKEIQPPSDFDSIQFILYGVGDKSISGRFDLIDSNGNQIVEIERSWNQSSLQVEMLCACFSGKYYVFPLRLYSGQNPANSSGIRLTSYYLKDGKCLLLGSEYSEEQKKAVYDICRYSMSGTARMLNNNIDIRTVKISYCRTGVDYIIKSDARGEIKMIPIE